MHIYVAGYTLILTLYTPTYAYIIVHVPYKKSKKL